MASKSDVQVSLQYIAALRHEYDVVFTDTHVHPFDVMGHVHHDDYDGHTDFELRHINTTSALDDVNYLSPSILDRLEQHAIIDIISPGLYRYLPSFITRSIADMYAHVGEKRILSELERCHLDRAVLLPIAPWVEHKKISKHHSLRKQFLLLASPDIYNRTTEELMNDIDSAKKAGIVGLKLHPNLQGFMPQPKDNPANLREKLYAIYQTANDLGLYLHFHGGKSFYTLKDDSRYPQSKRLANNGLLQNFINSDGSSEVFDKYTPPIIIAHLGLFGILRPDFSLLSNIAKRHSHVYFDTSGMSPKLIGKALQVVPSSRVVFGSDALYNKMSYSLHFLIKAIQQNIEVERQEKVICQVLGINYETILNSCKTC